MNEAEQGALGGCLKHEITIADVGSSVCQHFYEPTCIRDIVFPDWVLIGSRKRIKTLEECWSECSFRAKIDTFINAFMQESKNPFWTALHLCVSSNDYRDVARRGSGTLAHRIMNSFTNWLQCSQHQPHEIKRLLTDDGIVISAFAVAFFQFNDHFYQLLCRIYQFKTHSSLFVPYVQRAMKEKHFDKACKYVVTLGLHDNFGIADIAFPLYAQNKLHLVATYLLDRKKQQVQFVGFLDGLCRTDSKCEIEGVSQCSIPGLHAAMLEYKTLCKFVKKWAAKYQISEEHWPEGVYSKTSSTLRYFLHQFYQNKAVPKEDWEDMLINFVADNRRLQREAVNLLCSFGDLSLAIELAKKFHFDAKDDGLPYDVQDALGQCESDSIKNYSAALSNSWASRQVPLSHYGIDDDCDDDEFGWEDEDDDYDEDGEFYVVPASASAAVPNDKFYVPNFPMGNIHMVGTKEEYERCLRDIEKNAKTVAVDCEWCPMCVQSKMRLALIQLATEGRHVYLLDILSLQELLSDEHWSALIDKVFANSSILKLGFSFDGDYKMLASVHPVFEDMSQRVVSFVDIMTLCSNVLRQNPQLFKYYEGFEPSGRSLSTFVELCMKKPLDKTEQFSNWERRPLRPSQKMYAALDVCSLLDVYESLKENCTFRGIDLGTFNTDVPPV